MDPDTKNTKPSDQTQKQEAGKTVVPTRAQAVSNYTPPDDPSKYIRTYAKDVARVTQAQGGAVPPPQQHAVIQEAMPAAIQDTSVAGVSLPDYDPSPIDHGDDPSSPKEFEQEKVVLTDSDSDGIFSKPGGDAPDREAVLARLREKVGGGMQGINLAPSSMGVPIKNVASTGSLAIQPPPVVPVQEPAPGFSSTQTYLPSLAEQIAQLPPLQSSVPTELPQTPSIPVSSESLPSIPLNLPGQYTPPEFIAKKPAPPIPVSIPIPVPEPIPVPPPVAIQQPAYLPPSPPPQPRPTPPEPLRQVIPTATASPIHTYSSDFSDHIDQKNGSTFSVLAAQSDAGQTPRASAAPKKRSAIPLTIGIALLIVGAGVLGGAYYYATSHSNDVPVVAGVPSLITFDESVELSGVGPELIQALSDESQGGSVSGNVVVAYTTTAASGESTNTPQPGGTLIRAMALPAPDILMRNIDPSSTVGFIRAGSESRPFFLFKVNSYERTFAGMLTWERTINSDLATLYPAYAENVISTATSTASTTASFAIPASPMFVDAIVDNYDVRILRDSSGRSILLYGYHGKDTLIVARDEAAFSALISRLSATKN